MAQEGWRGRNPSPLIPYKAKKLINAVATALRGRKKETVDDRTLGALKGSIEKWEKVVAGTGTDEGWINCPLCKEFWRNDCKGCPVYEKTGLIGCRDTPCDDKGDYLESCSKDCDEPDDAILHHYAIEEVAFLKSLLPPD